MPIISKNDSNPPYFGGKTPEEKNNSIPDFSKEN